jgi:hypothetical protein
MPIHFEVYIDVALVSELDWVASLAEDEEGQFGLVADGSMGGSSARDGIVDIEADPAHVLNMVKVPLLA